MLIIIWVVHLDIDWITKMRQCDVIVDLSQFLDMNEPLQI